MHFPPMVTTSSANEIFVKLAHPQNAEAPMLVMLAGIEILARLKHPPNAEFSTMATPSGMA